MEDYPGRVRYVNKGNSIILLSGNNEVSCFELVVVRFSGKKCWKLLDVLVIEKVRSGGVICCSFLCGEQVGERMDRYVELKTQHFLL